MKEYVYAFEFCFCKHESGFGTISLHKTMKGAYKAMKQFIIEKAMESNNSGFRRYYFGYFELWRITKIEIKD